MSLRLGTEGAAPGIVSRSRAAMSARTASARCGSAFSKKSGGSVRPRSPLSSDDRRRWSNASASTTSRRRRLLPSRLRRDGAGFHDVVVFEVSARVWASCGASSALAAAPRGGLGMSTSITSAIVSKAARSRLRAARCRPLSSSSLAFIGRRRRLCALRRGVASALRSSNEADVFQSFKTQRRLARARGQILSRPATK